MSITINGNGTVTGISAGGLPAGSVTSATLADGAASVSRNSDWVTHGLAVSITPSSASNKILISGRLMVSEVAGESAGINLVLYKAGSILTASLGDAGSGQRRVTAVSTPGESKNVPPTL